MKLERRWKLFFLFVVFGSGLITYFTLFTQILGFFPTLTLFLGIGVSVYTLHKLFMS